ncbi:hypothetical protein LTR36_006213 [Oleoguttula mirabilis]|uniref:2EXR domain-containing protein n=1 Tax=Oleoguttula mirabilis TaxID=1507867 RepID=A0AAV9JD38_9PEZI|nr:hypothetical protein LTR36_006213 [Oleoguttula mirabilis]
MPENLAQTQAPQQPVSPPPLLALPPELRTRIWEYVFSSVADEHGSVCLTRTIQPQDEDEDEDAPWPSVLVLLETCRQIRDEAEGLFYHLNRLQLDFEDQYGSGRSSLASPVYFLDTVSARRGGATRRLTCFVADVETIGLVLKRCRRRLPRLVDVRIQFLPTVRAYYFSAAGVGAFEREWFFWRRDLRGLKSRIRDFRLAAPCPGGAAMRPTVERWEARMRAELGLVALG